MEVFLIHVSPWQTAITIHRFTGKDRHDELNTEQLTRSLSPHLPQCQSTHLTLNTTRRVLSRHTSTQASQTLFSHCRTLIQAPRTSLLPRRSISMPAIVHSKCLRPPIMHPLTPSCHPLRLPQSGDQSLLHPHWARTLKTVHQATSLCLKNEHSQSRSLNSSKKAAEFHRKRHLNLQCKSPHHRHWPLDPSQLQRLPVAQQHADKHGQTCQGKSRGFSAGKVCHLYFGLSNGLSSTC